MSFNILIVDDSQVMRTVIRRVLKLSGVELGTIYEADNGESALSVLDENWVDIVLSDVNMPVMDGAEFLKKMKSSESTENIPVIMVSTEGRDSKITELLEIGAAGYVTKPFKPEDIRQKISEALGVDLDGQYSEEPEDSDF